MAAGAGRSHPYAWVARGVWLGAAIPLVVLAARAARGGLGANPIAEALNALGLLALALLLLSLAATPLKMLTGWTWPVRARKPLGLAAFSYAALHVLVYAGLDQSFALRAIVADVTQRRFILVGFAAFVLLVPLAVTSTDRMVRRLGYARWKRLHRLAYVAAGCAVIHFVWRVKKDLNEPLAYVTVLALLLGVRAAAWALERSARRERALPSILR